MIRVGNQKLTYLKQLWQWGENTKTAVIAARGDNDSILTPLKDWQNKVDTMMVDKIEPKESDLWTLQQEGKRIAEQLNNDNQHTNGYLPYGEHNLPPLPYRYDALEPYICEEIMRLHHDKHHKSYVEGLNKAEKELYKSYQKQDNGLIKHWLREQAFNASGHYLHTIFWSNMTPESNKKPGGEIAQRINQDFGSWQALKKMFSDAAESVEGVGWSILAWSPRNGRLALQTFEKHQQFQIADIIPLLVLDMWEHAYYLQYKTDKQEYVSNWWNVVNWQDVNKRYNIAKQVQWPLF